MTPPSYHQCSKIDCFECHKNAVGAVFPTPHEKLREAWKKHVEYDDIIEELQDCADDASAYWLAKLDEALAADRLAQRAEMREAVHGMHFDTEAKDLSECIDVMPVSLKYVQKSAYNIALDMAIVVKRNVLALLTDNEAPENLKDVMKRTYE